MNRPQGVSNLSSCPAFVNDKLRILLIEDSAIDARLIERELSSAGYSFNLTMVENEAELRRELGPPPPDLVLSDHGLPAFDGFTALKIVREQYPKLPFIFVSGSNHQGMVLEMFDKGATDYVYKQDMRDLHEAVRQALLPESAPATTPTGVSDTDQSEFKLQLPPASAGQPIGRPHGRVTFCPRCMRSSDELGNSVRLENYLGGHDEVVVLRQVCPDCLQVHP
jgi:CheY-like chemotaxis protein